MRRTPIFAAAFVLVGGISWAARLVFGDTPWEPDAAALLAATVVALSSILVVATLLSPGRWVRNLAAAIGLVWAGFAAVLDVDGLWIAATVASGIGIGALWSRWADDWFRGQVKPDKVPARATTLSLVLIAIPAVIAVTADGSVAGTGWLAAGTGFVSAWAYARAISGSLWLVRLGVPLISLAAAVGLPVLSALVVIAAAAVLPGALAWTADARLAVEPLAPRSVEAVSILPEMVPADLMRSAGLDAKGMPLPEDPS